MTVESTINIKHTIITQYQILSKTIYILFRSDVKTFRGTDWAVGQSDADRDPDNFGGAELIKMENPPTCSPTVNLLVKIKSKYSNYPPCNASCLARVERRQCSRGSRSFSRQNWRWWRLKTRLKSSLTHENLQPRRWIVHDYCYRVIEI